MVVVAVELAHDGRGHSTMVSIHRRRTPTVVAWPRVASVVGDRNIPTMKMTTAAAAAVAVVAMTTAVAEVVVLQEVGMVVYVVGTKATSVGTKATSVGITVIAARHGLPLWWIRRGHHRPRDACVRCG